MHICMPLIILMKLTSSHSTPLTHLISLNSSHLCSYIYFFIFIYPSPLCFFIKLLTCGVIRSYNFLGVTGSRAAISLWLIIGMCANMDFNIRCFCCPSELGRPIFVPINEVFVPLQGPMYNLQSTAALCNTAPWGRSSICGSQH